MTANPSREHILYRLSDLFVHAFNLVRQGARSDQIIEKLLEALQDFRENRMRVVHDPGVVNRLTELLHNNESYRIWDAFLGLLTTRARNVVISTGATSVLGLAKMTRDELLRFRNCGDGTICEIEWQFRKYFGLRFGMSDDDLILAFGRTEPSPLDLYRSTLWSFLRLPIEHIKELNNDRDLFFKLRSANVHIGRDLTRLSEQNPPRNLTEADLKKVAQILGKYDLYMGMSPGQVDHDVRDYIMQKRDEVAQ